MKVEFNESFLKDLKAAKDKSILAKVKAASRSLFANARARVTKTELDDTIIIPDSSWGYAT